MVLTAMSFLFLGPNAIAKDSVEKVKKQVTSNAVTAASREIHKHALGIGLGQTFLMGKFENKGDNSITADLLYTYTASYSFDLMLNIHNSHHTYKEKAVWLRGYTMSIKARSYEFDAFSPFLLGGLGFYMPQITDSDGTSDAKFTFGYNFGAGVDLRLNHKMVIGIITQFHKPFEVKQDETDNVKGSYLKLLLTAMYLF